jgi:hypothetical protein
VVYPIFVEAPVLTPSVRGGAAKKPPASVNARAIMYARQNLPWTSWVKAWDGAGEAKVVDGASLLP